MDQGSKLLKGKNIPLKGDSYHAEKLIRSYICNSRADIITSICNMIITMYNKNNYIFYYTLYDILYALFTYYISCTM